MPDLADDFQNLYALLIEDEENVTALQGVIKEFHEKYGEQEKEKQLEEFVDTTGLSVSYVDFNKEKQTGFVKDKNTYATKIILKTD